MKFPFYSDPGHGWVKVPKSLLKSLKIEKDISHYSYIRNDSVYLEEDCDLSTFINAMKKINKGVTFNESHTNKSSKIRNYKSYGF